MIDRSKFESLADAFASVDDLEPIKRAYLREETIRSIVAETGETREIVAEQVDAFASTDEEAVTDLMDGHPTTLRDALMRYTDELAKRDELQPRDRVIDELDTLLAYPWSGEEATIQTHADRESLVLTVENPDGNEDFIRVRVGERTVYDGNHDDLGWSGMAGVRQVAEALHRAILARVIADRDHHVQLSSTDRRELIWFLENPNGSWHPGQPSRLSVDAVEGGGVIVRTRPYQILPVVKSRA